VETRASNGTRLYIGEIGGKMWQQRKAITYYIQEEEEEEDYEEVNRTKAVNDT
jgi:hypothetical protein